MAEKTLLQLVQAAALKLNTPFPTVVTTSNDTTILQMWQCLNDEVQEHCNRKFNFPKLKVDATFAYTTNVNYQALQLSTVPAMRSIVPRTLWNRTTRLECVGPFSDTQWAQTIALAVSGTVDYFRMAGDWLLIYPGHTASNTYGYTYMSQYGVQATAAGALKETFTVDSDVSLMPSRILRAGLEWRWRQTKGMQYAEEMETYELLLAEEAAREPLPGRLSMDNVADYKVAGPGLLIAAGSWNVP